MAKQPIDFLAKWRDVPQVWVDFETTGLDPLKDAAVEVALVRFANGEKVGEFAWRVDPGRPIPADATEVHGISDSDVRGAPSIEDVFDSSEVADLIKSAQPCAYNAQFDRHFVPPGVWDHEWPWLDAMVAYRALHPYAAGEGRYRLATACRESGMDEYTEHSALGDAEAAGQLFERLSSGLESKFFRNGSASSMGDVLARMEFLRIQQWHSFHGWLARQPEAASSHSDAVRQLKPLCKTTGMRGPDNDNQRR